MHANCFIYNAYLDDKASQRVCVCVCVREREHVWVSSFVGLWLLLANATDLTSERSVLMVCFYVMAPCPVHMCLLAVCL